MASASMNLMMKALRSYGFTLDQMQSLRPWVQSLFHRGVSQAELNLELRERPEFKSRFPVIDARERAGLSPMSVAEVLEYEVAVKDLMRRAGMPKGFYDSPMDAQRLLGLDLSVEEIRVRVQDVYDRVNSAPLEVRQAFLAYFPEATGALAAYMLDAENALPLLTQQAEAAVLGGNARNFGVDLTAQDALELAAADINEFQLRSALGELTTQDAPLFDESVSETTDLTIEEGLRARVGLGTDTEIRRRERQRRAAFSGQTDFASSEQGIVGLR